MRSAIVLSVTWTTVLLSALSSPVRAAPNDNSASNPTQSSSASGETLQEVIVSATRREESAATVPISLSALTQAQLTAAGIKDIADLAAATPGLQFSTPVAPSTITSVSIRGINTNTGPSTVGIYLDDTPLQTRLSPLGNVGGPIPLTIDLNRVEVARGPQGTLFGAGSEAGTVRFITNDPNLNHYSGAAEGELATTKGGEGSYEYGGSVGGPIESDTLGFRVSGWYRRDGGYVNLVDPLPGPSPNNAVVEPNVNRDYEEVFRAAFAYQVDNVRITPAFYYQSITRDDSGRFYPAYSNVAEQDYNDATFLPEHSADSWWLGSLKIDAPLSFADLTFTASYLHRDVTVNNDFGDCFVCFGGSGYGSPLGGDVPVSPGNAAPTVTGQRNEAYTGELRLASNDPAAFVTWVGGLFYDYRKQQDYQNTTQLSTNSSGAPVFLMNQNYKDTQFAVYGQGDVHLSKQWVVTLGLRVARVDTDFDATLAGAAPGSSPVVIPQPPQSATLSQTPTTPKVGLSYQLDPNNLLYVSATKGFRIGGGNAPLPAGCTGAGYNSGYGSDFVWSYELGAKDKFFDDRMEINSSVYHVLWSNIQQLIVASPCGISYVGNTGHAAANGFDLDLQALLTSDLRFDAKVAYTNAYYTESVYSGTTPTVLEGDKVGFLPQVIAPWNVVVAAQYVIPLASADRVHMRIEYQYDSENPGPFQNHIPNGTNYVPLLSANPATHLVNARIGYTTGRFDVSLFADNIFNSQPLIGSLSYLSISTPYRLSYSTFRPLTLGAALNYAF
jgi:iron complex outermembrane recepter protein